jgi:hypothetical protein
MSPGREPARAPESLLRLAYLRLLQTLRASESTRLGLIAWHVAGGSHRVFQRVPLPLRKICDYAQPVDPLRESAHPPPIDLVVACAARDVHNLRVVTEGALAAVRNPILRIRIITPSSTLSDPAAAAALSALRGSEPRCSVELDEDVIPRQVADAISAIHRPAGKSWVTQQVVKLSAVLSGPSPAALVVDADTVLIRARTWYTDDGVQLLQCAHEYHVPYIEHERRVFGPGFGASGVSFVTHHQLMQRDVVRQMFGDDGRGLVNWLRAADYAHPSALSEYESYAAYLLVHHRRRVRLARWDNHEWTTAGALASAADARSFVAQVQNEAPHACSVSCHSWRTGRPACDSDGHAGT